jgi:hypothetical protein
LRWHSTALKEKEQSSPNDENPNVLDKGKDQKREASQNPRGDPIHPEALPIPPEHRSPIKGKKRNGRFEGGENRNLKCARMELLSQDERKYPNQSDQRLIQKACEK